MIDDTAPVRWEITVGYSEVAMHMRVAGTRMLVERRPGGMAQLFTLAGAPFSFPVTAGEAGIGYDEAADPGTWSSASRQHYIDTGRYLTRAESAEESAD